MLPVGPWRPDAASPNSGFAVTAENAKPKRSGQKLGYGPFPALVQAIGAEALPDDPRGDVSLVKADGTYEVYFATATTIEQMDSSFQFTSVATGLNITAGDDMSFVPFGSYLINTNTTDGMAAYNFETPAGNNAISGAPASRFVFSANNVLIALDCDGNNRRMQTSGLGLYNAWSSDGADGKTFEDGGALISGCDLQNGAALIAQDNAIRLMQFGGAPDGAMYRISKVADGLGVVGPRALIGFNGKAWFMSSRGPYEYILGGQPRAIGEGKVADWFLSQISTEDLRKVKTWIDPESNVVGFQFRRNGVASTTIWEDCLCYDYEIGEWFTLDVTAALITRIATAGYTVDGPYASILVDDNPTPVDDRLYQGGQPVLAALDEDLKFATFSGTPLAATLETCEMTTFGHQRVTGVKAIVDTADATVRLGAKQRYQNSLTWGDAVALDVDGFAPVDEAGEVYALRMNVPAGSTWNNAEGFDGVEGTGAGSPR
jgi:hypothetical protein